MEQMPLKLLWSLDSPMQRDQKRSYCAPSWSWASTTGPCSLHILPEVPELEILEANIEASSEDSYGQVAPDRSIIVKGRLQTAQLVRDSHRHSSFIRVGEGVAIHDEQGKLVGIAYLDQDEGDLPLPITCSEITSGKHDSSL